jgi:uncharacterized phage-associated protein
MPTSTELAVWFASRDDDSEPDRTPMKLLKLIYFAQAHFLAATGEKLIPETTYAWPHGPVYLDARDAMKPSANRPFAPGGPAPKFDTAVEQFLEQIDRQYGSYSAATLRNLSHRDAPWKDHWTSTGWNIEIPDESMIEFYRRPEQARRWVDYAESVFVSEEIEEALDAVDIDAAAAKLRGALAGRC